MSTALSYPTSPSHYRGNEISSPSRGSMPLGGLRKPKRMFNTKPQHSAAALERFETGQTSATGAGKDSDGEAGERSQNMFDGSKSYVPGYNGQKGAKH
jgi:hypothetical protein